jgi:hypothetical protein
MYLFTHAWTMYRRNVGWLLLGAFLAAVVDAVVRYATATIGLSGGIALWQAGAGPSTAVATGFAALVAGLLVAQVIALILHGGMMKVAVDGARTGRSAGSGALFTGFSQVGSYAGLGAIVYIAMPLAAVAVDVVAMRVFPLVILLLVPLTLGVMLWITVKWVFALPLIADAGAGPLEAISRSAVMVRGDGWWSTFARLFVLGLGTVILTAVIIAAGRWRAAAGSTLGSVDVIFIELVVMPFVICYVAAMYLQSSGRRAPTIRAGAPPAWSAGPGDDPYGPPPGAAAGPDTGVASPPPPPRPAATIPPAAPWPAPASDRTAADRAWAAAADPLARPPAE